MALIAAGAVLSVGTAGAAQAAAGAPEAPVARAATSDSIAFSSDPTPEEQERLRQIAGAIWNDSLAAGWNMNSDVAAILSTATGEILKCSEAFALVPRPAGFIPGLGYLVNYWKNLRDYFLVVANDRTYGACVKATALNYRSAIEMASAGI
ncbi:hypothetical protein [Streptomyces scopuliridis]|uniref:Uncharacterized protein n=1 Tax=Streptomyces scopuliridis RB72 TaxID=1440053 RepID=A0A2T7T948_9ACTN|nr:hypothetical protein [Streptomyces scopuliridis]PVE11709.1 hypothetical protein Y717_28625 [Streptomyces scopuliridis RB72]